MRSPDGRRRRLGVRVALVATAAAVLVLGPAAAQAQAPSARDAPQLTQPRHQHTMCEMTYDDL